MTHEPFHPAGFPAWTIPPDIDTPALVVDVARMERNIAAMAKTLTDRGVALRPHAKTHKSVEIARRLIAGGAVGLTTATLGEAEVFAAGGIEDIFVAYPVWVAAPAKVDRLRRVAASTRLSVGVDSVAGAELLGAAMRGTGLPLRVLVEIDSGELRTGVRDPRDAADVAAAAAAAGLEVVGAFTHGGHSYLAPSAAEGAADDEVQVLTRAAEAMRAAGIEVTVLSAGSTPTASLSARSGVTEERPGTFVFGDRQQTMLGACRAADVALYVAATVVSTDGTGQVILDSGAKALAKDAPPLLVGHGALAAYPHARITKLYDHHALVDCSDGPLPALGEVVAVVPNHVCPVVNLAEDLLVLDGDQIVDRWPVDARARNR